MDSPYSSMNRDNLIARVENLEVELAIIMELNAQLNETVHILQKRCIELLDDVDRKHRDTFEYFQKTSARTLNPNLGKAESLSNYGLGLAGEAGEVCEPIKKHLFHSKELSVEHVSKELGDVLWYVAAIASTIGISLGDVAAANVAKLLARWPNGWPNHEVTK